MRHKFKTSWNAVGRNRPFALNARPHTSSVMRDVLQRFGWKTFQHPPCSPDLPPRDFHIFGDLKNDIHRRRFHSDEEVQE